MKKKKRRYSRLVILDSKNDTTKEIKKILSEKHPGYEKRSKDEKMFNQACEKISFYLLDGNIKKARSVLKRIPFVPIRLSKEEIDNIIQKYKKKLPAIGTLRIHFFQFQSDIGLAIGSNLSCDCSDAVFFSFKIFNIPFVFLFILLRFRNFT